MSAVEPPALVHGLQEPPDVLDIRVRERVVGVLPVHPLAEPLGLLGHHPGVVRDALLAALGELGEPVALDVALRVEPERLLHLDLDPEPLAVEPVLVALVVAVQRLVALEDVLERAPVPVVHARRVVRGDRAVHEAEGRTAAVLLAEALEGALALPQGEDLPLELGMIRLVRKRPERLRHAFDSSNGEQFDPVAR
jgi:hypothetical protein